MEEFEKARDKIMMGAERRSMVMSDKEKTNTAYHEAGHAIIGRWCQSMIPCTRLLLFPAAEHWVLPSICPKKIATA